MNGPAPKMDGTQACDRHSITVVTQCSDESEGMAVCHAAFGASLSLTTPGADLSGRGKYSH